MASGKQILVLASSVEAAEHIAHELNRNVDEQFDTSSREFSDSGGGPSSYLGVIVDRPHDALHIELVREQYDCPIVMLLDQESCELWTRAIALGVHDFFPADAVNKPAFGQTVVRAVLRAMSSEHLRDIVQHNADGTLVVDADGAILFANTAAARLFGRTREELIGEQLGFPISDDAPTEVDVLTKGGKTICTEMRVAQMNWDSQEAQVVSLRDVTDRIRAMELEQRMLHQDRLAAIGQLAAGVAHEINNPASFIQANCSLLAEDLELFIRQSSEARRAVQSISNEAGDLLEGIWLKHHFETRLRESKDMLDDCTAGVKRISRIVRDLSMFSRIERDDSEHCNVNDLVRSACSMVANEIRHRAQLVTDLKPVPLVSADRAKISQVIVNLLLNAAQSVDEGAAESNQVTVATEATEDDVIVIVRDTGRGMNPATLRRAFEPFFTTKPREVGTGLGLSLAAEMIRKHDGQLTATSTLGEGSEFRFWLPRLQEDLNGESDSKSNKPTPSTDSVTARILLVDDEEMVRKAFTRMLSPPHTVISVGSGAEALAIVAEDTNFDVIFCDLMMPQMDGPTLWQRIVEVEPKLARRMIFVTGGAFSDGAKSFVEEASPIVVEKPISRQLIRGLVRQMARTGTVNLS